MDATSESTVSLLKQNTQKFFGAFAIQIISFLLSYLINVAVARHLSQEAFGDFSVTLRVLTFCVPILLLGADLGINRYLPIYLKKEELEKAKGYLRWGIILLLKITLFVMISSLLFLLLAWILDKARIHTLDRWHTVFYALWLIPLMCCAAFFGSILNAIKKFYPFYIARSVIGQLVFLAAIYLIAVAVDRFNIYYALLCIGLQALSVIAFQFVNLKSSFPRGVINKQIIPLKKTWLRECLPMMTNKIVSYSLGAIDMVMIEALVKDENDVGRFGAILAITASIWTINYILFAILSQQVAVLFKSEQLDQLQQIMRRMNIIRIIALLVILAIIAIWGPSLLHHFGPGYVQAYGPLVITAIGISIIVSTNSAKLILLFCDLQKKAAQFEFLQLLLVIMLDFILIPYFGLYGAAMALLISGLLSKGAMAYLARTKTGIGMF